MLSTGFKLPQKGILIGIQVRPQPSGSPLASCLCFLLAPPAHKTTNARCLLNRWPKSFRLSAPHNASEALFTLFHTLSPATLRKSCVTWRRWPSIECVTQGSWTRNSDEQSRCCYTQTLKRRETDAKLSQQQLRHNLNWQIILCPNYVLTQQTQKLPFSVTQNQFY